MNNPISKFLCPAVFAVAASILFAGCATMGPDRPPVRPVDHACLAAAPTNRHVPVYTAGVPYDAIEIATVDSFVRDSRSPEQVQAMLADLRAKGAAAGADALMKVRMLHDRRRGYVNNPRTPFPSVMPGETKLYFLRASAVKFTKPMKGLPREARAEDFAKVDSAGTPGATGRGGGPLSLGAAAGAAPALPRF